MNCPPVEKQDSSSPPSMSKSCSSILIPVGVVVVAVGVDRVDLEDFLGADLVGEGVELRGAYSGSKHSNPSSAVKEIETK